MSIWHIKFRDTFDLRMKLGLFFVALSGAAAQDSNDPDYDYSLIEWADGLLVDGGKISSIFSHKISLETIKLFWCERIVIIYKFQYEINGQWLQK